MKFLKTRPDKRTSVLFLIVLVLTAGAAALLKPWWDRRRKPSADVELPPQPPAGDEPPLWPVRPVTTWTVDLQNKAQEAPVFKIPDLERPVIEIRANETADRKAERRAPMRGVSRHRAGVLVTLALMVSFASSAIAKPFWRHMPLHPPTWSFDGFKPTVTSTDTTPDSDALSTATQGDDVAQDSVASSTDTTDDSTPADTTTTDSSTEAVTTNRHRYRHHWRGHSNNGTPAGADTTGAETAATDTATDTTSGTSTETTATEAATTDTSSTTAPNEATGLPVGTTTDTTPSETGTVTTPMATATTPTDTGTATTPTTTHTATTTGTTTGTATTPTDTATATTPTDTATATTPTDTATATTPTDTATATTPTETQTSTTPTTTHTATSTATTPTETHTSTTSTTTHTATTPTTTATTAKAPTTTTGKTATVNTTPTTTTTKSTTTTATTPTTTATAPTSTTGTTATSTTTTSTTTSPTNTTTSPTPLGIPGNWKLVLDSEFDTNSLNTNVWRTGWFGTGVTSSPGDGGICNSSSNVTFPGDGTMHLNVTATPSSCTGEGTYPYTGAIVDTDPEDGRSSGGYQYTYGVVEARIDVPAQGAQVAGWPGFWGDGQNWPADGEDDIMEGLSGQLCWHFHSPLGGPGGCDTSLSPGWHTFASDWQPGSVTYYYDGVKVGSIANGITAAPMYIILSNGYPTNANNMEADSLRVQYVRLWQ